MVVHSLHASSYLAHDYEISHSRKSLFEALHKPIAREWSLKTGTSRAARSPRRLLRPRRLNGALGSTAPEASRAN